MQDIIMPIHQLAGSVRIEFLVKIPIAQNQWGNEGPEVERHADPTGCNLHPHSWLICIHIQPI